MNTAPSENCAYGYICLDPNDFKCKVLDTALTAWYGRDATNDYCIILNVQNAALCKGKYFGKMEKWGYWGGLYWGKYRENLLGNYTDEIIEEGIGDGF